MSEFAHCNDEMVARAKYLVEILLDMTTLLSSVWNGVIYPDVMLDK